MAFRHRWEIPAFAGMTLNPEMTFNLLLPPEYVIPAKAGISIGKENASRHKSQAGALFAAEAAPTGVCHSSL